MFHNSRLLSDLQNSMVEIYNEKDLKSLRSDDCTLHGRNILEWYYKSVDKLERHKQRDFDYHKCLDDILFCSDELMFFTGNLFLYLPFINDPIAEAFTIEGGMLYPNNQNIPGKRYNMFADITYQVVYNYWDKIGDLLASFFPEKFKPSNIFFHTSVSAIYNDYKTTESIKWLTTFRLNEFEELNHKRKQVVHYNTFDTSFKSDHWKNADDFTTINELQAERKFLAEYFKNHINLSLQGFENAIIFVEEL